MVARVKKMQPFDNYELVRATSRTIKSAILASADRSKNAEFIEEHNKVDGGEVGILLVRYYGDWDTPDDGEGLVVFRKAGKAINKRDWSVGDQSPISAIELVVQYRYVIISISN